MIKTGYSLECHTLRRGMGAMTAEGHIVPHENGGVPRIKSRKGLDRGIDREFWISEENFGAKKIFQNIQEKICC